MSLREALFEAIGVNLLFQAVLGLLDRQVYNRFGGFLRYVGKISG